MPFVKCVSPYSVILGTSKQLVPCGNCWVCRQNKNKVHAQQLSLTQSQYRYCYFITLTYDENSVPRFQVCQETSVSSDFSDLNLRSLTLDGKISPNLDGFNDTTQFHSIEWSLKPLFTRSHWNTRRTARISEDIELNTIRLPKTFSMLEFVPLLEKYWRIRNYYNTKLRSTPINIPVGTVDLLYPRDLKLFIYSIRNYVRKTYNEVPLYYAIGEYGVKSLRPHWHLLLFFNSADFDRDLQAASTTSADGKTYQCSIVSKYWQYGIADTRKTDGGCSSYVSSYLNRPSDFPQILEYLSRPKCYHSPRLGQTLSQNLVKQIVDSRNFGAFEQLSAHSNTGLPYSYSLWSAYYDRLFPTFSFSACHSKRDFKDVYTNCKRIVEYCQQKVTGSVFACASYWFTCLDEYVKYGVVSGPLDLLEWSKVIYTSQLNCDLSLLGSISSIFYYYNRFNRACSYLYGNTFSNSVNEFCSVLNDFNRYRDRSLLIRHYHQCETNPVYADSYYRNIISLDASDPTFNTYLKMSSRVYLKNIKHREYSDLYKFC